MSPCRLTPSEEKSKVLIDSNWGSRYIPAERKLLSFDPWNLIRVMPAKGSAFFRKLPAASENSRLPIPGAFFMIEIRNFTKSFHNRLVIGDFSLFAREGTLTALLGPSGCGKSTFFDLLMGNISRDGGKLFLSGKEIPHLKGTAAYMSQKDLLLPWLTLRENALLPIAVKKTPSASDIREAEELFELLGLSGSGDLYPRHVSGGMAQRCTLARTILFRTPIILLDEPFSAVDAITRQNLRSLLLLLRSRFRKTLLMITHDVEDALLLADSIIILSSAPMTAREKLAIPTPKENRQGDPSLQEKKERILAMLQEKVS